MNAVVRHQQGTILGDIQAVGTVAKVPLAEGAQVVSLTVKHHDRVLTAGEDIDIVPNIHGDSGAFLKGEARGQLAPALDILIAKVSDSVHFTHCAPLGCWQVPCGSQDHPSAAAASCSSGILKPAA